MIEPGAGRAKHLGQRILSSLAIAAVFLLLSVSRLRRGHDPARRDDGNGFRRLCLGVCGRCKTIRTPYPVRRRDTIRVAAGEYDELVRIDLDGITVEGSGASTHHRDRACACGRHRNHIPRLRFGFGPCGRSASGAAPRASSRREDASPSNLICSWRRRASV